MKCAAGVQGASRRLHGKTQAEKEEAQNAFIFYTFESTAWHDCIRRVICF